MGVASMPVIDGPTTFAEIWEAVDAIPGWMTAREAEALHCAACQTASDGTIVEVGSFCGRSLAVLAESGREVIAIDPLVAGMSVAKTPIDEAVISNLSAVVAAYPNVTWQRCRSAESALPQRVDMLHIDGCHKHPAPLDDFEHFEPAFVDGAIVAFHDYGREAGVIEAVRTLIERKSIEPVLRLSGTMCITRSTKGSHG